MDPNIHLCEQTDRSRDSGITLNRRAFVAAAAIGGAGAVVGTSPFTAQAAGPVVSTHKPAHPMIGYVLAHEQFPVPQLVEYGVAAEKAGFDMVWTSDHLQPWQANEGHAGQAWITLSALGQRTTRLTMGTGVTCPTYRYRPAVVAEAFASLGLLYPNRIFLGTGTGEALNEKAGGGGWGHYPERAARWVEAVGLIRKLWTGEIVNHSGQYYQVQDCKLYDLPASPVPLYMAANGPKSARLAGLYGDGLITTLQNLQDTTYRAAWEAGVRAAGKDPAQQPILIEQFVVLGGNPEAARAAELWRFEPKAWKPGYVTNPDPRKIQSRAEAEIPLPSVYGAWTVSTDPAVHAQAIQKAIAAGVTHIIIHSAEADQVGVINFFGQHVLPRVPGH